MHLSKHIREFEAAAQEAPIKDLLGDLKALGALREELVADEEAARAAIEGIVQKRAETKRARRQSDPEWQYRHGDKAPLLETVETSPTDSMPMEAFAKRWGERGAHEFRELAMLREMGTGQRAQANPGDTLRAIAQRREILEAELRRRYAAGEEPRELQKLRADLLTASRAVLTARESLRCARVRARQAPPLLMSEMDEATSQASTEVDEAERQAGELWRRARSEFGITLEQAA